MNLIHFPVENTAQISVEFKTKSYLAVRREANTVQKNVLYRVSGVDQLISEWEVVLVGGQENTQMYFSA